MVDDVEVPVEPVVSVESDWFVDVYRSQWEGMVRLAFVMVGDLAVAEELVQDAFARVYRARASVREPLPYVRSAVYNACRNYHRGERTRRSTPMHRDSDASPAGDHVIDVIRRLPARQRGLVVLRYYAGLTDAEIAATTGLPLGTVKSTLHRTLVELRKELS